MTERSARVAEIRELAPYIFELVLEPVSPPEVTARPGQFVSLRLPGGAGERRSYSITSPPGDTRRIALLVRDSGGTGARFLTSLRPGDEVSYFGPMGYFLTDETHPGDLVFAATGVGASAMFPMMEEVLARPDAGQVHFFWGLERADELFWRARLEALEANPRFAPHVVYAAEGQGFITPQVIATARSLSRPTYYLCGNGDMVRDVIAGLIAAGVDRRRQIRTEAFAPPSS